MKGIPMGTQPKNSSRRQSRRKVSESQVVNVAGYVRCSDEEQSSRSDYNTLEAQRNMIEQYVSLRVSTGAEWEMGEVYVDDGFSGKNMERPALARLLRDVEAGLYQVVVVYKLDRITRNIADFFRMDDVLEQQGCSLVSVKENLDTSTPMGRAMRNILLVFAQLERETNSERVRDKMLAEAKLGRHLGGNKPYGFDVKDRKLVVIPEEAKVVRLMYEKYVETRSLSRVRDYINGLGYRTRTRQWKGRPVGGKPWTMQNLEQILHSPRYKGTYTFDSVEVPDNHEAIVSTELWELAQKVQVSRSRLAKGTIGGFDKHVYLLQGAVECACCGSKMTPHHVDHTNNPRKKKPYTAYYVCTKTQRYRDDGKCPVSRYNAERLEEAVLGKLEALEHDPRTLGRLLETLDASEEDAAKRQRLTELRQALPSVRGKISNLVEAVAEGTALASLAPRLAELERQERELAVEAAALETALGREKEPLDLEDVRRWFRDIRELMMEAGPEKRKRIMQGLVRKVEAKGKEAVRVTYTIAPSLPPEALGSSLNQAWLPSIVIARTSRRNVRVRKRPRFW